MQHDQIIVKVFLVEGSKQNDNVILIFQFQQKTIVETKASFNFESYKF